VFALDLLRRMAAAGFLSLPEPLLLRVVGPPARSPEGWTLDVQSQALLWLMRAVRESAEYSDVGGARRTLDRSAQVLAPHSRHAARVEDREVPGATGLRRARVYSGAARGSLAPGLVWFHGGGFALGSIESHDDVCRALASRARVTVVSVDYRLAPEHRFPAGVEDAVAATRWVLESGRQIGINPAAVAVGGDSAGGNLAAVVAQVLRASSPRPTFQLLAYPPTDATCREASHHFFAEGYMLTERTIQWFLDHYIADRSLETEPRVSPLFCADLSGLPPALVITAGFDPLRDEGRAYADRMRAAGVPVEYVCAQGSLHGFLSTAGVLRESARVLDLAADAVRRALRSVPTTDR
jgi:acetyl esterase/lipase